MQQHPRLKKWDGKNILDTSLPKKSDIDFLVSVTKIALMRLEMFDDALFAPVEKRKDCVHIECSGHSKWLELLHHNYCNLSYLIISKEIKNEKEAASFIKSIKEDKKLMKKWSIDKIHARDVRNFQEFRGIIIMAINLDENSGFFSVLDPAGNDEMHPLRMDVLKNKLKESFDPYQKFIDDMRDPIKRRSEYLRAANVILECDKNTGLCFYFSQLVNRKTFRYEMVNHFPELWEACKDMVTSFDEFWFKDNKERAFFLVLAAEICNIKYNLKT